MKKKYKLGYWVWVLSPIKGDINKKTGIGQEIRIAVIEKYLDKNNKYKVQMFSKQDKKHTNWVYYRKNGQIIKGRDYYYRSIKASFILRNDKKMPPLSVKELEEINIIRIAKRKELETQRKEVIRKLKDNQYSR